MKWLERKRRGNRDTISRFSKISQLCLSQNVLKEMAAVKEKDCGRKKW